MMKGQCIIMVGRLACKAQNAAAVVRLGVYGRRSLQGRLPALLRSGAAGRCYLEDLQGTTTPLRHIGGEID